MGYYTWYEFSTEHNKYRTSDIIEYMKEKEKNNDWFYPFACALNDKDTNIESFSDFSLSADDTTKWYDHDSDMLELSRMFPETVFCLYGEGEETGDLWYTYYKNGKKQYCPAKIVYDEYDESKLI